MYDSIAFREYVDDDDADDDQWGNTDEGTGRDSDTGTDTDTDTLTNVAAEARALGLSLAVDGPLLRVRSCFGGLMVYRWRAVYGLRYGSTKGTSAGGASTDAGIDVERGVGDCEHVLLHKHMAQRGHGRIFLAPSLIYMHGH